MKYTIIICLLFLSGCALFQTTPALPDVKTRSVLVDFETQTVEVAWCLPDLKGVCTICGEFALPYSEFKELSDAALTERIVTSIKNAEVRSGEACTRKGK